MRSNLDGPIVVNVLTGFLGAGKTTLLNGLLQEPDLSDVAVIINEFGSVGIDHLLVETIDDDTVLLQSGCICCTIRGDLKQAILSLFEKRQAGRIAPFRRLVIETTGLADPAPIVATLTADLMLKYHFTMGNIIAVVDVPNGRHNLEAYAESARQVAVADRIVVTKGDLAEAEAMRDLRALLSDMNRTARVDICNPGQSVTGLVLTEDIHDLGARSGDVRRWISAERHHDHAHGPLPDVNLHGAIRSTIVRAARPLSWPRFSMWLSMLVNRHGTQLLRIKGILDIEGHPTPVVIHGVQHLIHKPVHLAEWPKGLIGSVIVFITDGEIGDLDRSFTAFMKQEQQPGAAADPVAAALANRINGFTG